MLAGMSPIEAPFRVVAPYRFNPLGAHVDHQGGPVLARTLDRGTRVDARPIRARRLVLRADIDGSIHRFESRIGDAPAKVRWQRYAQAAANVLDARHRLARGIEADVDGSMIAAGLSSSASYLLATLVALAEANDLSLSPDELVDAVREVEHEHLGLTNGVQDQMSIVHGRTGALARLDVDAGTALHVKDPPEAAGARWLLCFSGVSRELVGSGFNTRVAECREAAARLHPGATRLGDVPIEARDPSRLPAMLARRARHVFDEIDRVEAGAAAWERGDVAAFGTLMDASCRSSIECYESGSEWLVALHEIARDVPGVRGNRFSGGGYGGCLVMLADADGTDRAEAIGDEVLERYLARYPELRGVAHRFVAGDANGVRVERAAPTPSPGSSPGPSA